MNTLNILNIFFIPGGFFSSIKDFVPAKTNPQAVQKQESFFKFSSISELLSLFKTGKPIQQGSFNSFLQKSTIFVS